MSKYLKALNHTTIREVINLAEARRLHEDAEEAKRPVGASLMDGFMERMEQGPDPIHQALHDRVDALNDAQKDELLALMWLGRADAGETVEMWNDLLAAAHSEDEKSATLLGKSPLGIYLIKGLDHLGE